MIKITKQKTKKELRIAEEEKKATAELNKEDKPQFPPQPKREDKQFRDLTPQELEWFKNFTETGKYIAQVYLSLRTPHARITLDIIEGTAEIIKTEKIELEEDGK